MLQDANKFHANDLNDLAIRSLKFIRSLVAKHPAAAQDLCRLENQRLLYVLARLEAAACRRLLSHVGVPFKPRAAEIEQALDLIQNDYRPKGLVNAHPFFEANEREAHELIEIQRDFWMLMRQEARAQHFAFAVTFDIDDHQLINRIAELSLQEIRSIARFPIALRIAPATALEMAIQLEGQGASNPRRLAVAGLAVGCYDGPATPHNQEVSL